jgi:NAD+ synthase (glutamine-hydrolysing)
MNLLRVAAGVLNQTPLDWSGNLQRVIQAIQQAKSHGVAILCLPEMCLTGYGCEDAFLAPHVQALSLQHLQRVAQETRGMAVAVGLPVSHAGGLFNTVAMLVDGHVVGLAAKQHLAGDGLHYEPRWFKRWPAQQSVMIELAGQSLPLGDLIFDIGGCKVGFEICEDAWVGSRPGAGLAQRGVDIILNPSASHFAFGKHEVRRRFVIEGSRAFQVSYVYANLVGNEAGRTIYDGDAMIASGGKLLAIGRRFSFADVEVTSALVDLKWTRMLRLQTASFQPQVQSQGTSRVVEVDFTLPAATLVPTAPGHPSATPATLAALHNVELVAVSCDLSTEADDCSTSTAPMPDAMLDTLPTKELEFTYAVALGLFDYLRKSRSHGFVVSLSGGADSAAVTLLTWFSWYLAVRHLGPDGLLKKTRFIPAVSELLTRAMAEPKPGMNPAELAQQLAHRTIWTVYQRTDNSGPVTEQAAQVIADWVGARHGVWDVQPQLELYHRLAESSLGRPLNWKTDDITLQNIQARTRSPGVWMLANLHNALLLSTSNRSEAAVGYATMDGDTSGGLAPIAGIDKNFLRHWLRWLAAEGLPGLGPIPAVEAINNQQPTAELRPPQQSQTDEGDLMPYDLLDTIERLAIRDKMSPAEVLEHVAFQFSQYTAESLKIWVGRFFVLFSRNQWKRERYAPSFHLDDENLDPKTWCRWPILSGGFAEELKAINPANERT